MGKEMGEKYIKICVVKAEKLLFENLKIKIYRIKNLPFVLYGC